MINRRSGKRRVLCVIMDGIGESSQIYGNAALLAPTPNLKFLRAQGLFQTLKAHGRAVGMPSDEDLGNSEVGHNALGAGRVFDQGAKLVQRSLDSGDLFKGEVWNQILDHVRTNQGTLHFLGLLSDGNVHGHENHLYSMMRQACNEGVKRIRIHVLFDGRDVPERSAEIYIKRLLTVMDGLRTSGCDVMVASGGGRMTITMDRYNADWTMVHKGWKVHVQGEGRAFSDIQKALEQLRRETGKSDQFLPEFVIADSNGPVGKIGDKDAVILWNFRGDRAIEISRAFTEESFDAFPRGKPIKALFAGMMQYDGDLQIPPRYLVSPPVIKDTLGEYLAHLGCRQYACSETQKFGHVTYFWNGNRSGYFDRNLEDYHEIPSDLGDFQWRPWMKAANITDITLQKMQKNEFDFGRINFANGDMVGHTGDLGAAIVAVAAVDLMIGRLINQANKDGTILLVTADHGNCDEMFEGKVPLTGHEDPWGLRQNPSPVAKTAHTRNPVPMAIWDPLGNGDWALTHTPDAGLGNIANTILSLMGENCRDLYLPTLVKRVNEVSQ